ncbi:hypothetical protein BE20_03600 [Sorangium cellulosum]|nr:hypothetical protein BE20_03600 [Sorangium cellulosum]
MTPSCSRSSSYPASPAAPAVRSSRTTGCAPGPRRATSLAARYVAERPHPGALAPARRDRHRPARVDGVQGERAARGARRHLFRL